jgi:hypothetical protein
MLKLIQLKNLVLLFKDLLRISHPIAEFIELKWSALSASVAKHPETPPIPLPPAGVNRTVRLSVNTGDCAFTN